MYYNYAYISMEVTNAVRVRVSVYLGAISGFPRNHATRPGKGFIEGVMIN